MAATEPGRRRVVVTGIGVVCPVGKTREAAWDGLKAGRSGVAPIQRIETDGLATTFAGEVADFDPAAILGRKEARRTDRYSQFALVAALAAMEQSGLRIDGGNGDRVGVLIGTAMGGVETIESGVAQVLTEGPRRLSPFFIPMLLPNMASGNVAIVIGARGPNYAPTSACASSAHAIGEAAAMIRRGWADAMVVGGSEAAITRVTVGGFNAMGALSTRNDAPAEASRPFDAERDGFVIAEGGAVLVLEALEQARDRGATVLGEVLGYGSSDDAHHIVQPAPGGVGIVAAMRLALAEAGLRPEQIDYVNAHGTSTQLNEKLETEALKTVFGGHAARLPISSTKSMTGHLLGAAGALEAAISLLAMRDGCLPPTINQTTADPACDLDYVPNEARAATPRWVMSNSLGFGGHNVSLVLGKGEDTD